MEKQKDHVSPPQNKQYSLQWENYEIPQHYRREIIADVHPLPSHIQIEHRASSSGDQASILIQGDETMEQNVADNTVVKKPHVGNSGAGAGLDIVIDPIYTKILWIPANRTPVKEIRVYLTDEHGNAPPFTNCNIMGTLVSIPH